MRGVLQIKVYLLGWTKQEIGKAVGLAQSSITEKLSDLPELLKLIKSLLDRGETVEKVAEKLKIDLTLAWAILLEGKDDIERNLNLQHKPQLRNRTKNAKFLIIIAIKI